MTVECKIGPIELDAAQLVDGDVNERPQNLEKYLSPGGRRLSPGLRDKNEGFSVYCKKYQALQISGLAGWKELEWIDSSTSLLDNDDIVHRGWGLIGKTNLLVYPGVYSDVELEVAIASPHEKETLLMDYVKGEYSQLIMGFEDYMRDNVFSDTFTTFNTGVWEVKNTNGFEKYFVTPSGGNLTFAGRLGAGQDEGYGIIMDPTVRDAPFTVKATISNTNTWSTSNPSSQVSVRLAIVLWKPENWTAWKSGLTEPYLDDFEDNKYTGRSAPYINWVAMSGTPSIESASPIAGNYSLKHTGNGSDVISNGLKAPLTYPQKVNFRFKFASQGSGANTPYAIIWASRYVDASNVIRVDTYFDGTNQVLRVLKVESGVSTALGNTNWMNGKVPAGTVYDFSITDTGSNIKVNINGTNRINVNYSTPVSSGYSAIGANVNSACVWDQIQVAPTSTNSEDEIHSNGVDIRESGYCLRSGLQKDALNTNRYNYDVQGWAWSDFIRYNMIISSIPSGDYECKVEVDKEGYFSIYRNNTLIYTSPIQVPLTGGFQAGMLFSIVDPNNTKTTYSLTLKDFEAYETVPYPHQVILPPGAEVINTPDDYRASRFGNMPVFLNPARGEEFTIDPSLYDKGGPMLWSSENEFSDRRRVFSQEEILNLDNFELENGIIQIKQSQDTIQLSNYICKLTENQATLNTNLTGLGGYSENTSHTFTRDTSKYDGPPASAKITSNYSGSQYVGINIIDPTSKVEVLPNNEYYGWAMVATDKIGGATVSIDILWFDSLGTYLSTSSSGGGLVRSDFEKIEVTGTSPATAAIAYILVVASDLSSGESLWYDSGDLWGWELQEEISIGESLNQLKIEEINRELITLRINRTTWTMRRGDPVLKIQHPYNALDLTLATCYYHDATTTSAPAADADISMLVDNYCLKWDKGSGTCASPSPSQDWRILILQTNPTTIKSDSIPATAETGIGIFDNRETPTDPSGYLGLAGFFVNRGRQKIKLP